MIKIKLKIFSYFSTIHLLLFILSLSGLPLCWGESWESDHEYQTYLKKYGGRELAKKKLEADEAERAQKNKAKLKLDALGTGPGAGAAKGDSSEVEGQNPIGKMFSQLTKLGKFGKGGNENENSGSPGAADLAKLAGSANLAQLNPSDLTQVMTMGPLGGVLKSSPKLLELMTKFASNKEILSQGFAIFTNKALVEQYRNTSLIFFGVNFILGLILGRNSKGIFKSIMRKIFLFGTLSAGEVFIFAYYFPTLFKSITSVFKEVFLT